MSQPLSKKYLCVIPVHYTLATELIILMCQYSLRFIIVYMSSRKFNWRNLMVRVFGSEYDIGTCDTDLNVCILKNR